jgi:hypothetical protein
MPATTGDARVVAAFDHARRKALIGCAASAEKKMHVARVPARQADEVQTVIQRYLTRTFVVSPDGRESGGIEARRGLRAAGAAQKR